VCSREAFPEAVDAITDVIVKIDKGWGLLKRVEEYGNAASHPEQPEAQ